MFRAIILPIFRSTRLCVTACGIMHPRCSRPVALYIIPQAVTHSLVFLKMGKIIARNMLSWLELLTSRYCFFQLDVYITYFNDARSSKYQIMKYICWLNIQKCVLWRVAKRLSYTEDARCLKVKILWISKIGAYFCLTICPLQESKSSNIGNNFNNQNSIQEEIRSTMKSRNACYHSLQNFFFQFPTQKFKD